MESKQPNTFVRALIVGLVLSLSTLAFFNFFWREPPFEISTGLLALLALIVLLCLSEAFDHLTFGTVLSLKRKVEEEKASKETLRQDNRDLRSQLVTMLTSFQQSQVNNTFHAPPEAWAKLLGVVQSPEPATKDEDVDAHIATPAIAQMEPSDASRQTSRQRFERQRAADSIAIRKYLDSIQVPQSERLLNAEFSSSFQNIDPIMDRRIVFDAYVKADTRERFVEATRVRNSALVTDKLYVMLTKIWLYRQAKKVQAELILLLVETEEAELDEKSRSTNRLIEYFQPAIANDILRVESIKVTAAEIDLELSGNQNSLL